MAVLGILLSHYWKPLALGLLVAGAFAYRGVLIHQRDEARTQVDQLTAEAVTLRSANQAMGATVDRQNAAVAAVKARADAAVNAMAADVMSAAREGAAVENSAQQQGRALIAAPIDVDAGCEGAIRWGNAQAAELASW
jgi:hypothetical protein